MAGMQKDRHLWSGPEGRRREFDGGICAWTVAMKTDATPRPFAPSRTDGSQWRKKKREGIKRGKGEGGSDEKLIDGLHVRVSKDNRTRRKSPCDWERSPGQGLVCSINFYQRN